MKSERVCLDCTTILTGGRSPRCDACRSLAAKKLAARKAAKKQLRRKQRVEADPEYRERRLATFREWWRTHGQDFNAKRRAQTSEARGGRAPSKHDRLATTDAPRVCISCAGLITAGHSPRCQTCRTSHYRERLRKNLCAKRARDKEMLP